MAVETLKIAPQRVNTIIDFAAANRWGAQAVGSAAATDIRVVAELAEQVAAGQLEVPIARSYPLEAVRDAFRDLEQRHTRGKIVLRP